MPPLEGGRWTSHWLRAGHPVLEVIPSWAASVPAGSSLRVELQGERDGRETAWYPLCDWSEDASRTSIPGVVDGDARVAVDTLVAGQPLDGVRMRVSLQGVGVVRSVSVSMWDGVVAERGRPAGGSAVDLDVPSLSQQAYAGIAPEVDGGGASWCSPTSLAMVLTWHGVELADPVVHAARGTFDRAYGGCGNWSFSVAYAALHGLAAVVTRLGSLAEAESLLREGVPPILSICAAPGALAAFPLPGGTAGHLLVLRGVTATGDAIVNDPAAPEAASVRRIYDPRELEDAWLDGSGGVAYVIRKPSATAQA